MCDRWFQLTMFNRTLAFSSQIFPTSRNSSGPNPLTYPHLLSFLSQSVSKFISSLRCTFWFIFSTFTSGQATGISRRDYRESLVARFPPSPSSSPPPVCSPNKWQWALKTGTTQCHTLFLKRPPMTSPTTWTTLGSLSMTHTPRPLALSHRVPPAFPLAHAIMATLASSVLLRQGPASRHLHWSPPQPGMPISAWLIPASHSALCPNGTSSTESLLTTLFKI